MRPQDYPVGQRVAVVQVLAEVEVAFAVVGEADEEPGDVERLADGFVAGAVVSYAAGEGADGGERAGVDAAGLEQAQVVGAQGGGESRRALCPFCR